MRDVEECLRGLGREPADTSRVALISRRPRPDLQASLAETLGVERVVNPVLVGGLAELHLELTLTGPYDVVVDVAGGSAGRRLAELVYHLRAGGVWLVRSPEDDAELRDALAGIDAARAARVAAPTRGGVGDDRPTRERQWAALAHSTRTLPTGSGLVAVEMTRDTLAKVPDPQSHRLVEWDETYAVWLTVPAGEVVRAAPFASSEPSPLNPFPASYAAPVMTLRSLREVTCRPGQIAYKRGVILPESYNRPGKQRLRSKSQVDWADHFVLAPTGPAPTRRLEGAHFHLDSLYQGHFGHALAEQVSRLWAWPEAKRRDPGLRLLLQDPRGRIDPWQHDLLRAAGVEADDVVVEAAPVVVEVLVSASAMFSRPDYVHPALRQVYDRIGSELASRSTERRWPERVFMSRRPTRRVCRNGPAVEDLHREHGFEVILPEDHSLADQAEFARQARVVSGYAGSNLFQIALAGGPRHVIAIAPLSYPVHNEYLFSALLGHRLDLVLCRPDFERPADHFSAEAFQSSYQVDPEREGAFLREVLRGL